MRSLVLVGLLGFVTLAHADAARDALEEVSRCAAIADAAERLKCYDAAAPRVKGALSAAPAPVAKEKGILDWFGFSRQPEKTQKAEDFGKPAPPPAPERVDSVGASVIELARTARGKAIWILHNGQVWRQIDSDTTEVEFPPAGTTMKVTIETGFLGSYNLSIAGINGIVKVNRLK
jgi:hypothetical protein